MRIATISAIIHPCNGRMASSNTCRYSYDNGGRLSQAIDSATNLTEEYTWNADNTLATMPGSGYTREFGYNEEAQLLSISHSGTLAYQYAYGADGNRRWAKDIANNKWTWYPCGVACGAGELVEQGSDLTGTTWTTNAQYLRAGGGCNSMLIRRKSSTDDEYHHEDPLGVFGVITGANGAVLSSNIYDAFDVLQFSTGGKLSLYISEGIHTLHAGTNIAVLGQEVYVADRAVSLTSRSRPEKPAPKKHIDPSACNFWCRFIGKYAAGRLFGCHCDGSAGGGTGGGKGGGKGSGGGGNGGSGGGTHTCPTGTSWKQVTCAGDETASGCFPITYIACCSSGSPYIGPPPCPASVMSSSYLMVD